MAEVKTCAVCGGTLAYWGGPSSMSIHRDPQTCIAYALSSIANKLEYFVEVDVRDRSR